MIYQIVWSKVKNRGFVISSPPSLILLNLVLKRTIYGHLSCFYYAVLVNYTYHKYNQS